MLVFFLAKEIHILKFREGFSHKQYQSCRRMVTLVIGLLDASLP